MKQQGQAQPSEVRAEAAPSSPAQRLRSILLDFQNRVLKYQHYRRAFIALQNTGLLDQFDSEMVSGSHCVLHGSGANSVTVVRPHGTSSEHSRHRFRRSLMSIVASASQASASHVG